MALRPFPQTSTSVQSSRSPIEPVGREMAPPLRPRHKASFSISEQSRSQTPILNTSASFPSLRAASAMSYRSPPTPQNQGKLSNLANATKQRAKDVWSRRRPSPELETSIRPVQEFLMDSPTIPGHPAIVSPHERNPSFSNNWRQNVFGEAMLSGIEPPMTIAHMLLNDTHQTDSSPDVEKPISPLALNQSPVTSHGDVEAPPKVPPKESMESSQADSELSRRIQRDRSNSALKCELPSRTSSTLGNMRPKEICIPRKKVSCDISSEGRGVNIPESRSTPMEKAIDTAMSMPIRPCADAAPIPKSSSVVFGSRPKLHVDTNQILSPASQKGEEPVKKHRTRRRKSSTTDAALPIGTRPSEAGIQLSKADIETLQHAAKLQTESYDVLKPVDVRFLEKELTQLESRCQYLKETQKSLRAGRKTLQTRMLTYLRSSRSGVFSRESLLKQEEALAELDEAIEDWDSKVEKAEERRLHVSRKLLEHAAAALSIPSDHDHILPLGVMATPPGTPERPKRQRTETESITVYALLADVEQELGRMLS
ncbi:Up-regulated during septation-domain-containing protein [Kalaharituber pfeilii]|nr:Up-regulated during septation-domain-containing protein [Kalaharituber pfeilii]